jgi:hypothetical protein
LDKYLAEQNEKCHRERDEFERRCAERADMEPVFMKQARASLSTKAAPRSKFKFIYVMAKTASKKEKKIFVCVWHLALNRQLLIRQANALPLRYFTHLSILALF